MEQTLHYVWKYKLYQKNLKTTDGVSIEILDPGLHNINDGPDFCNSKIKIGDRTWVGNIEIHENSKDWYRHKHDKNKLYNSVILHVVSSASCEIQNLNGYTVPQCEILYSKHIKENIDFLLETDVAVPCCNYLESISKIHQHSWLNTLLLERLERKSNDISNLYKQLNNSYSDTFYVLLARSMGFGLNSDAFEKLARSLPLNFILKQASSPIQIEALLFGQAGMLSNIENPDFYTKNLIKEYDFLKNKFSLKAIDKSIFRNLRIRPASSPYIRIAQLATLLQSFQGLFSKVIECKDLGKIRLLFHVNASEYWQTHYIFGEEIARKNKYIGDMSLDIMIINSVIPLIFFYGKKLDDENYISRALDFLESIKPESNSITKSFSSYGVIAENAFHSQALIQLKREYCEKKKCLYCRFGYSILSEK